MRLMLAAILLLNSLPLIPPSPAYGRVRISNPLPQETASPSPSPTPTPDPVLEQATREALLAAQLKAKAVADKDRAEAEAAELKAKIQPLGATTVSVPTGSVTTDAAGWVESQMLAQEAARQITAQLTKAFCESPKDTSGTDMTVSKIVIHSPNDLTAVELYSAVIGQLARLKSELETKNNEATAMLQATDPDAPPAAAALIPLAAAPGVATSVVKSVAEFVNLFRTDTSFQNASVNITEDMIVSHVAKTLMDNGFKLNSKAIVTCTQRPVIYYPSLFPPSLTQQADTTNSDLFRNLDGIEMARIQMDGNLGVIDARVKTLNDLLGKIAEKKAKDDELTKKNAALKALEKKRPRTKAIRDQIESVKGDIGKLNDAIIKLILTPAQDGNKDSFKEWIAKLTDLKTKMQGLLTAVGLITAKLNTPDDSGKLTALAQLLRAERLQTILKDANTYTLRVSAKANGTTKIKKNLFVDAKVRHSAGANLVYLLFNNAGGVAQGGALSCYIDYQSAKSVKQIVTGGRFVFCESNNASR
jgi:hypothetical protein